MTNEIYETVISALSEAIKLKDSLIYVKDCEISNLKKKLEDAEKLLANNKERNE